MPEFTYEITEKIGTLSQSPSGWSRQLNMISWNGRAPKYDIRDWSPDRKMRKGVTLTNEEAKVLMKALESRDL